MRLCPQYTGSPVITLRNPSSRLPPPYHTLEVQPSKAAYVAISHPQIFVEKEDRAAPELQYSAWGVEGLHDYFLSECMKLVFSTSHYSWPSFISDLGTTIYIINDLDLALHLPSFLLPPTRACTHTRKHIHANIIWPAIFHLLDPGIQTSECILESYKLEWQLFFMKSSR